MTEPTAQQVNDTVASPSRNASSTAGIDIRDALDILNARVVDKHDQTECCHGNSDGVPEEAKAMGQTIDLMKSTENHSNETTTKDTKQNEKLRDELNTMTSSQLLRIVLTTQQDRVVTYRQYNEGLETVLANRDLTAYPTHCAAATASFATQSNLVNCVLQILLDKKDRKDLAKLLQSLQKQEGEKLNTTAALHLDKIRKAGLTQEAEHSTTTQTLLQQSISSLEQKQVQCVEQINEVLEEIRYALVDEEE